MSSAIEDVDSVISLRGVGKTYRLYHRPAYRVLDLFGLCPQGPAYFTERAALKDITLEIRRGEKVAIIGRNGAGKSTLLKIVTETITPSSGTVRFRGRVSPLLQIGTGFHGDFTGRQNVYASLAHMGVTGAAAHQRFEEIVAFAELEEYIDQAVKTYSTGMGARLMFATATAIEPEVLVVDELLGVGDAYFAHKSFERMRQMSSDSGTTLLLVTHDVYSALNLCERFVWIDRGQILMEGDGRSIVSAYEQSIKEQEEQRLRLRNRSAVEPARATTHRLHVQVRSRTGFALSEPLALAKIELQGANGTTHVLPVATGASGWTLQPEANLGPETTVKGIPCRCLTPYGSIYHKAEWTVDVPSLPAAVSAQWHYSGAEEAEIVTLGPDMKVLARAPLTPALDWQERSWGVGEVADDPRPTASGHYGSGRLRIRHVAFLDEAGQPVVRARHGAPLLIEVQVEVMTDRPPDDPTFVIAFHRPGVAAGGYVHADRLKIPATPRFTIRTHLDALLLGSGGWLITVGLAESDFYRASFHPYFTVNEKWHHVIARGFELQVEATTSIDGAAFFVQPARLEVARIEDVPAADAGRS